MRIKDGYIMRKVAGTTVIISLNGENCSKLMTLNLSGEDMWNLLQQDIGLAQLIEKMSEIYDVDRGELEKDVLRFLDKLREVGMLVEES